MVTSVGGVSTELRQRTRSRAGSVAAPVTAVNDPVAADGCPIEAPDGKALFFASVRGPGGDNDIWMATRSSVDAEFGAPAMLPAPVNSDAQDFCPTPLRGGALLFVSTRGGTDAYGTVSCGLGDIYITHRNWRTGTWAEPRNLGCAPNGPNGAGMEYGPSLVHTKVGTFLYFSSGDPIGAGTQDIYVSRRGYGLTVRRSHAGGRAQHRRLRRLHAQRQPRRSGDRVRLVAARWSWCVGHLHLDARLGLGPRGVIR